MAQKKEQARFITVHSVLGDAVTSTVGENALFCSYMAMVAVLTLTIHTIGSVVGLV